MKYWNLMNEKAFSVRRSHFNNQQSEFSNQQFMWFLGGPRPQQFVGVFG